MPLETISLAVAGGVDAVHLREPTASAADLLRRGEQVRDAVAGRARFVVNDRLDVALALGADGAQLGVRSLPVARARAIAPELPLGASVHSVAEAQEAAAAGADWLLLGTIFASGSHPGQPGAGTSLIAAARRKAGVPIVAIGGIDAANAAACVAAGAHGVAVISAIVGAADPAAAAAALRDAVEGARL